MSLPRNLTALALLFFAACSGSRELPPNTPETNAMELVASAFTRFEGSEQRTPRDWQELMAAHGGSFSVDQLAPQSLPSVRYELIFPPLEVAEPTRGKLLVVAVTRKPMREPVRLLGARAGTKISDPGRYLIFRAPDGKFSSGWFLEPDIQAMWSAAGRALPVPDHEPERPWLRERRKADLGLLAYFAAVATGLWLILRWARRLRKRMSEV